ncbi:MAG: LytR/AlgR family response regulator transcription factor [Rhodoferax sp.]
MRVLVVDDEPLARTRLCQLLAECSQPRAEVLAQAANAAQALAALQSQTVDVVLLDIHMPGADGLALAPLLRALAQPPAVVFVTAHPEHAVQAFEVEALDYLTKPVRRERLQAALLKAQRQLGIAVAEPAPEPVLVIQDRHRTERVPLSEVVYCKAELKYVTVRTAQRSYIWDGSLSELEARYPQRFLRVHRNALIARHAVRALERCLDGAEGEGWQVRLAAVDERIAVSRRQLAHVRELVAAQGGE